MILRIFLVVGAKKLKKVEFCVILFIKLFVIDKNSKKIQL